MTPDSSTAGRGYFDNMNAFFAGNGYQVMDQSTIPDTKIGFSNAWGMADEYVFDAALEAADTAHAENRPFFFHIMTTSNHRPYTYPEARIPIPSGTRTQWRGHVHGLRHRPAAASSQNA